MPRRTRASTNPAPSTAHTALIADLAALFEQHGVALGRAVRLLPELGTPLQQQEEHERGSWSRGERRRPAAEWRLLDYGLLPYLPPVPTALYAAIEALGLRKRGLIAEERQGQALFMAVVVRLSEAGRAYYDANWAAYAERYPHVQAPPPPPALQT